MADKRIQDLTPATSVQTSDRFVLEQGGQAKSLTGQVLITDLATALDGHGGITDITYSAPVSPSLNGTLTITTADAETFTASVTNGRGITGITWSSSGTPGDGLTHTGTIAYNDGTTSTVTFQDGVKGNTGAQTYVWFKWANVYPESNSDMQSSVGPYIGIYSGTAQHWMDNIFTDICNKREFAFADVLIFNYIVYGESNQPHRWFPLTYVYDGEYDTILQKTASTLISREIAERWMKVFGYDNLDGLRHKIAKVNESIQSNIRVRCSYNAAFYEAQLLGDFIKPEDLGKLR